MKEILIASTNTGKIEQFKQLFKELQIDIKLSNKNINVIEDKKL